MKHLLKHLPEVRRRLQGFGRVLLGLDYDGTLTPIRPAPELAVLSPSGYAVLTRLQQKSAVILAILSGRSLQDIKSKVPLPQVWFGGSHGLELEGPGHRFVHPEALSFKAVLRRIKEELSPWVNIFPGLLLESKPYSLAVHYRQVSARMFPDLKRNFNTWRRAYKNIAECLPGKKVWELKPRIAWDKGRAFRYIMDYESRRLPAGECYPLLLHFRSPFLLPHHSFRRAAISFSKPRFDGK